LCGGIFSLPGFFTISAGSMLGTQTVLVVQLASSLVASFIIDCVDGTVAITNYVKIVSLVVIVGGVALENSGGMSLSGGASAIISLALVALSGIGYALQSKCNTALGNDLGSPARATIVSACVFIVLSLPIDAYLLWGKHVYPMLNPKFWYLWILAGFQSAFYIGSYAYLPKVLGFTSCFVLELVSKMTTSLAIDASGLTGERIPVTAIRICSLAVVLAGAVAHNLTCSRSNDEAQECSSALMVHPVEIHRDSDLDQSPKGGSTM
jgi:uncharacterized membrane protein YdcZ (DUF606 family)